MHRYPDGFMGHPECYYHKFKDGTEVFIAVEEWGIQIEPLRPESQLKTYRLFTGQVYVEAYQEIQLPLPLEGL